jgi:mono/diheme cytochrome c family protein
MNQEPEQHHDWLFGAAMGSIAMISVALAVGAAVVAFFVGRDTKHPTTSIAGATTQGALVRVDSHVAGGAHLFVQFACAQCHGLQGQGGVSPAVPALTQAGKQLTAAQLRHIINHGLGESANPTQPYMPVWGAVISDTQLNDLVAYIRAGLPSVPTATPPQVPQGQGSAVEGATLYVTYGCINCHGPNGLGGVPDPSRRTRRSRRSRVSPSASNSIRTPRPRP